MQTFPYVPRRFVPDTIDLASIGELTPLFQRLKTQLESARSPADLEAWIEAHGEVSAAIDECRSLRYIAMTCQTDDPAKEQAYLHFVEQVDPWLKPLQFELTQMLVDKPAFNQLDSYYFLARRSAENRVKLYREKNIARETEEAQLTQKYQKISGAMTVQFDGKEQTLAQLGKVQQETDRARRQAAWETAAKRRLQDRDKLDDLYEQLLVLRGEIAREAGFSDYRAYTFANYERFDYTPEDCLAFHDAIEKHIVPLARELQAKRRKNLGLDTLRPWDLAVDPFQLPALKPFQTGEELMDKSRRVFAKLDPRLEQFFNVLQSRQLVDLDNRKGKAPGGYQSTLAESRVPFIFMNSVGLHRDVETLFHEAGHAFHALAARDQKIYAYRGAPIEFCEVASMAMELLAAPHLTEFYTVDEVRRAQRDHLEGIIKFFPWMACVDAFQHWIYTHPAHTRAERGDYWQQLAARFGTGVDWSGFEEVQRSNWHAQLHIFEIPFYYVEYGIAQLGALQVWKKARQSPVVALEEYLNGLAQGGSKPLPDLFTAAGIAFDFTAGTIAPLMECVQGELQSLEKEKA